MHTGGGDHGREAGAAGAFVAAATAAWAAATTTAAVPRYPALEMRMC
jgi:hypothetical protein